MKKIIYGILPLFVFVFTSINLSACSNGGDDDPTDLENNQVSNTTPPQDEDENGNATEDEENNGGSADNENNNGDTTTPNIPATETEEIIGYWLCTKQNKYGVNLFLNDDGTCHAETWSWSTSSASWNRYYVSALFYWNYDKETKDLVTTYGSWQFKISLLNEKAMVGYKEGGNSNSRNQSWNKASCIATAYFLLRNLKWTDSSNNSISFENCSISEDENDSDMIFNYYYNNQSGKIEVTYPYSPARTTLIFSGVFKGKFTLQGQD